MNNNQPISVEKILEMFGRKCLEFELLRQENEQLRQQLNNLKKLKNAKDGQSD